MLPISRRMSSATRPRELHLITGAAHLGRLKPDQSPDTPLPCTSDAPQVLQSTFKDPAGALGAAQWPSPPQRTEGSTQGSEGRPALLCETSPAPLTNTATHISGRAQLRGMLASHSDPSLYVHSVPQVRTLHTSSSASYDSTSYNVTNVPDFFVRYKHHRATPSADPERHDRTREDIGLMNSLTDSILAGDVVATTRRLKSKIPVEHKATEGRIVHPSGFVVPGPGHTSTSDVARAKERERNEKKDRAAQTAAVAHRVLESDLEQVAATTLTPQHKVPFEVCEPDGTVKHPSGFVPPTPAHKFRYTINTTPLRDRKVSAVRQTFRQPSPPRGVLRAVHTASAQNSPGDAQVEY